jgi:broad specificity phosphatase PhoE
VGTTLVLIRHAESDKNVSKSFSATHGGEALTPTGLAQARRARRLVAELACEVVREPPVIYLSPTERSRATARLVFETETWLEMDELAPIRSPFPGMSERQVQHRAPEFLAAVSAYRLGLRNAYDIPRGSGESVREFETRVLSGLARIVSRPSPSVAIVGHQSTLTALMLHAARCLWSYPQHWYGHVSLPLCSVSVLEVSKDSRVRAVHLAAGSTNEVEADAGR